MIFVLSRGIAGGRRVGLISASGVALGLLMHSIIASLGLSFVFAAVPGLASVIRIVGGLYLGYLGYRTFRSSASLTAKGGGDIRRCLFQGFLSNALNPKIVLFFLAFLPQFVVPGSDTARAELFLLGLSYAVITLVLYGGVGLFAGALGDVLIKRPHIDRMIRILSGGILLSLGVLILYPEIAGLIQAR